MRLSDAIALGRTLDHVWEHGSIYGSCAMMIAGLAANGQGTDWLTNIERPQEDVEIPCTCLAHEVTSQVSETEAFCYNTRFLRISSAVIHMFNFHVVFKQDWTLDQVIDWVRSIEPQETALLNVQLTETETVKVLA